jgi:hypothetical protein
MCVLKLCCAMIRKSMFLTQAIHGLILPGCGTKLLSNWCIIFSDRTLVCHLQRSHISLRSASWNMNEEFIYWTFDPWRWNHYAASEQQARSTQRRGAFDSLKSRRDCMFLNLTIAWRTGSVLMPWKVEVVLLSHSSYLWYIIHDLLRTVARRWFSVAHVYDFVSTRCVVPSTDRRKNSWLIKVRLWNVM